MSTGKHRQVSIMNIMVIFHSCSHISFYLYTGLYHSVVEIMIHHKRKVVFVNCALYTMITTCKGLYCLHLVKVKKDGWDNTSYNFLCFALALKTTSVSKLLLSHFHWSTSLLPPQIYLAHFALWDSKSLIWNLPDLIWLCR